jgi:hypothetical protein
MKRIALEFADGLVVKADPVDMAAAVPMQREATAVGQFRGDTVAGGIVLVRECRELTRARSKDLLGEMTCSRVRQTDSRHFVARVDQLPGGIVAEAVVADFRALPRARLAADLGDQPSAEVALVVMP